MLTDVELMRLLDHRLGGPSLQRGNVVHVGIHVGGVVNLATGSNFVEPSGNDNYFRSAIANNAESWTPSAQLIAGPYAGSIAKYNAVEILFDAPTSSWGVATHVGLFSTATGGTPFALAVIVGGPLAIDEGALLRLHPGGLMLLARRFE